MYSLDGLLADEGTEYSVRAAQCESIRVWLAGDIARVVPVRVLLTDRSVIAVDDQLAAFALSESPAAP